MPSKTYYPSTNDGRAAWWQNIQANSPNLLNSLGFTTAQINGIQNDAAWAVYSYLTVRTAYDEFIRSVYQYADNIAHGTPDGALPPQPQPPAFPVSPDSAVAADFEARRERWVQQIKSNPAYNTTIGATLGLESPAPSFNKGGYQCQLYALGALNAHTVGGKFRKANGAVEGINLYGRKLGATTWTLLGRYTVTPFTASVPLTGSVPEQWEFMARAVAKDAEFGQDSAVGEVIVRP